MPLPGYLYILASRPNGTLYTGVTSDLVKRVWQHREELVDGFIRRYHVHTFAYYEVHDDISGAIAREKQVKRWRRRWKARLIERMNPEWRDLYSDILGGSPPARG